MRLNKKIHDFDECKEIGLKAEKLIINNFKEVFRPILLKMIKNKQIIYNTNDNDSINKQKKGIDGQVLINYDVKSLSHEYKHETRIILETVSNIDYGTKGWLYTCDSIIVLVYWDEEEKTTFYKGYLLFPKIIRKWFEDKKEQYNENCRTTSSIKNENGKKYRWITEFYLIPICDLPMNCYKQISSDLFTKKDNMLLSSYFKDFEDGEKESILPLENIPNLTAKNGKLAYITLGDVLG